MNENQNHIHLFGDAQENFYILGKKDKSSFEEIYHQISMLCARNQAMAKMVKISTEFSTQLIKKPEDEFYHHLKAYAEGLERPVQDIIFSMLLPEIVASFNKWVPNLLSLIPGCSSLFIKDPNTKQVLHGRILDYALSGPFEKHERSILYEFAGRPKVFSYSTTGMPTPSLTAMNEHGLSLALHYKHGQYFNLEGDSIFKISNKVINECHDIREAIKLIKSQESISYWGIYLCDKQGAVASIDIKGPEIYQEKFDLNDHEYLYFNNRPLLKQADQANISPFGNAQQCQMRRNSLDVSMKNYNQSAHKDPLNKLVKTLGRPQARKMKSAQKWNLTPTNPGSIQLCAFDLTNSRSLSIPGMAPKFYQGHVDEYLDIFSHIKFKEIRPKSESNSAYLKGQRQLSQYQSAMDLNHPEQAYHYIQMAICHFEGHPEKYIAKFFYTITQYLYESDKRDYTYLYEDFCALQGKLPEYLEDHLQLFLLRTGKIIGHKSNNEVSKIQNKQLQEYYLHEFKLNAIGIRALKLLIFPRIEILDIIYSY